jgi:hypothetical protein
MLNLPPAETPTVEACANKKPQRLNEYLISGAAWNIYA